jgi:hypothetical protein
MSTLGKSWHRKDKYLILNRMATDPELSSYEAARLFGVGRSTIIRWCREAGISLEGHCHPRVSFILRLKVRKRDRLIRELAQVERDIKSLKQFDPDEAYKKPTKKVKAF